MIVQIVRFTSRMDAEAVQATYVERAPRYRKVPGLVQKYYLAYPSGEHGAVYVWESAEALAEFRRSDLARTIAEAYQVEGDPESEVCDVVLALHESAQAV